MRVCDICAKRRHLNRVSIGNGLLTNNYEVCDMCAKKLKKFIRYVKVLGGVSVKCVVMDPNKSRS